MVGHLNGFLPREGENLNKNVSKIQMLGVLPGGGGCWSLDLIGTLSSCSLNQIKSHSTAATFTFSLRPRRLKVSGDIPQDSAG